MSQRIQPPGIHRKRKVILCLVLTLYALFRIALLPENGGFSFGFTHDSAYIASLARNLLAGRGFVLEANWLVFVQPKQLPMPFRNANPLYAVLIAATSKLTGLDVFQAGFLISALASVGLVLGLYLLAEHFFREWRYSLCVGAACAFFPPLFGDSLRYLPDALCLALTVGFLAALVRTEWRWSAILAGLLLGLAWLTRSSVILILPATLVFLVVQQGWRKGLRQLAWITLAALLVSSPWLIRTARVMGSPFQSDASYALLQDYYANRRGIATEQFWYSPTPPPSLPKTVVDDPVGVAAYVLKGIPVFIRKVGADWSQSNPIAAFLIVILILGAVLESKRYRNAPALLGGLVYAAAAALVFLPRWSSLEPRYLALLTTIAALWMGVGTVWAYLRIGRGERSLISGTVLVTAFLFLLLFVPRFDWKLYSGLSARDPWLAEYRAMTAQVNREYAHGKTVVVSAPYFYNLETSAPAVSIPYSDDAFLLQYMDRYGAQHVVLGEKELAFWRPQWAVGRLPPGIRLKAQLGTFRVYEKVPDR